jgi:hypothetical protein
MGEAGIAGSTWWKLDKVLVKLVNSKAFGIVLPGRNKMTRQFDYPAM